MMRSLLLLLLMATLLGAASVKAELDTAKKNLYSSSKSNIFKAYDTYKKHYLKSIMSGDQKIQERCLNGIVIAGKKLHIDVSNYQTKLDDIEATSTATTVSKKSKKIQKKASKTQKKSKVKIRSQRAFRDFSWDGGTLELNFDFVLKSKDINYFKLRAEGKKGYRYIFDIRAVMFKKPKIRHKELTRVSLSQYNREKLRLVIESQHPLNLHFRRIDQTLEIDLGVSGVVAPKATDNSDKQQKRSRLIIIDPGHGGKDGGAVGYSKKLEKDIVLAISKRLAKILKKEGYRVKMTRESNVYRSLKWRTKFTRKHNPDLFISIHANAVPKKNARKAQGIEIYYLDPKKGSKRSSSLERKENAADYRAMDQRFGKLFSATQSRAKVLASNFLAIDLGRNVVGKLRYEKYKIKDAKVAGGNFWVLVGATSASALVEVGFVSHPQEEKRLVSAKYQQTFAEGLADGIEQYFVNKSKLH